MLKVPEEVYKLSKEIVSYLENNVGKALKVTNVSPDGHIEVKLGRIPNLGNNHKIWIESELVEPVLILDDSSI